MTKPIINSFNTFAPLLVQQYERYLPTAFDESLSLLQKVNKIIKFCNEIGLATNDLVTQWNDVMEWVMSDGLNDAVSSKLDQMVADGTFESLLTDLLTDLGSTPTRLTGETDDTLALQRAINDASTKSKVVRLTANKTYTISSMLTLPSSIDISFKSFGMATIKATALMGSMIYKPSGYVEKPTFDGIILDGNGLADKCLVMEQANQPRFYNSEFKNARNTVLEFGIDNGSGSLVYEARFQGFKITGIDSGLFPSSALPFYGINAKKGSTDNHFDDIVIRNVKSAGIRDEGANNTYGIVHIFGYPEPDYIPDYGLDLVAGRAIVKGLFTDGVRLAGIKIRDSFVQIVNSLFYWRFDTTWDKSGSTALEINDGCTNIIYVGNEIRGAIDTDVRFLGSTISGVFHGNSTVSVTNPIDMYLYNSRPLHVGKKSWFNEGLEVLTGGAIVKGKSSFTQENAGDSEYILDMIGINNSKYLTLQMGAPGAPRWKYQKTGTPETGGNVGSDFAIVGVMDDNTTQSTMFKITRSDKSITSYGNIYFNNLFNGPVIKSPDGSQWRLNVDNSGVVTTTKL